MKKFLVFLLAVALLSGGCTGQQKTVKNGDNIFVDYAGRTEDGKVFDTSIESVAKENNIYVAGRKYQPLNFTVGKGEMIKGFDEGVIGMKVGETKNLTIPPEKGYGHVDPGAIQVIPIIESVPATTILPSIFEIPANQFEALFGPNHTVGDNMNITGTNVNLTVRSIGTNVSLAYNFSIGYKIIQTDAPWSKTVISIDDKNITIRADVKKNDVIQLQSVPWNTTVIDVNSTDITLKHNAIPDTEILSKSGSVRVHFNETSIILDRNNELAGRTLIFQVTLNGITNATQKQPRVIDTAALYAQVMPPEGIILPGTWQNIGPELVAGGAIDLEKFKALYNSSGRPLTEEQIAFFTKGSNKTIHLTPENAHFILNILWAIGLVNKNPVLSEGPMGQYIIEGNAGNFASTGGWSLGTKPGGELLNSADIIMLTPEQQAVVERVAMNSYRPCCGNPASLPDCNHGAAALGLAELLASQGATADEIAAAVKAANSMWFSQKYLELAVYFKATEDRDWNDVDPWVAVGKEYSSSSGWANMHKKLKEIITIPQAPGKGGSCDIGNK